MVAKVSSIDVPASGVACLSVSWAGPENCAHCHVGTVCSLLLVRADYIGPRPRRGLDSRGPGTEADTTHRPISLAKFRVSELNLKLTGMPVAGYGLGRVGNERSL